MSSSVDFENVRRLAQIRKKYSILNTNILLFFKIQYRQVNLKFVKY